jgi:hypothetical protein
MTLCVAKLSIVKFSIMVYFQHSAYAIPSIKKSVLCAIMLSVAFYFFVALNVNTMSAVILNVVAPLL